LTPPPRGPTLDGKIGEDGVVLDKALLIQLLGSALAVSLLVALAAWARIARPTPPLDGDSARALLAFEFPDEQIDALWIAADGAGVVARSGRHALILWRKGDGYVAREAAWADIQTAKAHKGWLRLKAGDGAPRLAVKDGAWPPPEFAPREVAA
jgi:hypothetical protein